MLLEVGEPNHQRVLAHKIIANSLSVRELENIVKKIRPKRPRQKVVKKAVDPHKLLIEEELQQLLGTKVKVNKSRKRGYIQIEFYSHEELERLFKLLRKVKE